MQKEQITTTYVKGKRSLVQEPVDNGAIGACPDVYLVANVLMLEGLNALICQRYQCLITSRRSRSEY
jgi:hypothetical protein